MDNPHSNVQPDYMLPEYNAARLVLTIEGKTNKEAASFLKEVWKSTNKKACVEWDLR